MKCLWALLGSCLILVACSTTPEPAGPVVSDASTFLGLAVGEVSELPDPLARAELYVRIATAYRALGDEQSLRSLATSAFELVRGVGLTEDSARTQLSLAPLLASVGDDESAGAVLETGLEYAADSSDSALRSVILPLVVQAALQSEEAARPVVRRAVDEVFVIEDPRARAEALIRIAELYQAGDAFLSVTGLIQQAIPAIRSSEGAYVRAQLFTRLALLAAATQESRLSFRLAENAVIDVRSADAPADNSDAERLLAVVDRLAVLGRREAATSLLDSFARPYFRLRALLLLAASYEARRDQLDLIETARELLSDIPDTRDLVDARIRVGIALGEAQAQTDALSQAQAAAGLIVDNEEIYSRIEPPARLAELLVLLDRPEAIQALLEEAPDAYIRGAVAVRAADKLIALERSAQADEFLTNALIASDEATYLVDGLRRQIVGGFARTGSIRLAIRTLERMDDELLFAQALVELAVVAEPAGLVTPILRSDLASVLASR